MSPSGSREVERSAASICMENVLNHTKTFAERHGLAFSNIKLLAQAFTHRSYVNENPSADWANNERLEFLGDAVLELITTAFLFDKYPNQPEGELTAYRAALVNTKSLAEAAIETGMSEYLLLSKGEAKDAESRAREHILANTFEAVLGAIYVDQGYEAAQALVAKILFPKIENIVQNELYKDPKSRIQEWSQEHHGVTPTYEVESDEGPDHDKLFVVGIYFGEKKIATGTGRSKQDAQQKAAEAAWETVHEA